MQRDHLERHASSPGRRRHRVEPEHHHPGHPEEQDVVAGDQHRGRIERAQRRRSARGQPMVENGQSPEENQVSSTSGSWVQPSPGGSSPGPTQRTSTVRPVPDRDAVAPPELPGDRPVVHVVDPVEVPGRQLRRVDRGPALAHRVAGGLGQRCDLDEPLQATAAVRPRRRSASSARPRARTASSRPTIRPCRAQRLLDRGPRLEPVQPVENRSGAGDPGILGEDRRHRQAVPAADLEVVGVVRRGHLHRAGAERRVDVLVGHDRDLPTDQRQHRRCGRPGARSARRPGARRSPCHRAWSPPGWWRPPRRSCPSPSPYRIDTSSPASSECSTSMSESAVRQPGHQLMIRSAR